jgi:hypothetical protein
MQIGRRPDLPHDLQALRPKAVHFSLDDLLVPLPSEDGETFCLRVLVGVFYACTNGDAALRPTASQIAAALHTVEELGVGEKEASESETAEIGTEGAVQGHRSGGEKEGERHWREAQGGGMDDGDKEGGLRCGEGQGAGKDNGDREGGLLCREGQGGEMVDLGLAKEGVLRSKGGDEGEMDDGEKEGGLHGREAHEGEMIDTVIEKEANSESGQGLTESSLAHEQPEEPECKSAPEKDAEKEQTAGRICEETAPAAPTSESKA